MQPATLVSVEEYLRTSYDPDVDYVDGVLEDRNVGEFDHSVLQTQISSWILQNCQAMGLSAFVELRTRIHGRRYRVPDILVLEGKWPKTKVLERAPLVAIEILSPEDRMTRVRARIEDYLSIGTRFVWLIDPAVRRAWVYTKGSTEEVKDGVLRIDSPEVAVPLAEIFATIDQMSE